MANRLAFQTQLASIMEVLANAAVAEICKLVDDDYAVINLQMSQCQRENKALKRKLHLLELRMARGYAERRIRENSLNRSSRVHVNAALSEKYSANAADVFQNQGELYRRQLNEQVWREGDSSGADVVIDPVIKGDVNGPGGSSQTGPTAVLVKAETGDGNHAQQQLFIREDGVTEAVCEAAEADYGAPPADKADAQHSRTRHQQALEPQNTEGDDPDVLFIKEEHSEQERKENQTHAGLSLQDGFVESSTDICGGSVSSSPTQITVALGAEESDGLDSSLMKGDGTEEEQTSISHPSPEVQITIQSVVRSQRRSWDVPSSASHLQGAAESSNVPSQITQRRKRATSVEVTNANPYDQPPAFPRWASSSPSASQPSCSYIVDEDDCVLVQPLPLAARGPQKDLDGSTGNRVRDAGVDADWSQVQPQQFGHFSRTEGTQLNVAQSFPKISMNAQTLANLNHPGVSMPGPQLPKRMLKGKRKSYICRYCGKAFTGQSNLEAHQRIHTGEKPFKCETCGKLFTEAGNLKKHQRVHTGEKPFVCNRCGKRFAWICNLRTHQQSASCGGV